MRTGELLVRTGVSTALLAACARSTPQPQVESTSTPAIVATGEPNNLSPSPIACTFSDVRLGGGIGGAEDSISADSTTFNKSLADYQLKNKVVFEFGDFSQFSTGFDGWHGFAKICDVDKESPLLTEQNLVKEQLVGRTVAFLNNGEEHFMISLQPFETGEQDLPMEPVIISTEAHGDEVYFIETYLDGANYMRRIRHRYDAAQERAVELPAMEVAVETLFLREQPDTKSKMIGMRGKGDQLTIFEEGATAKGKDIWLPVLIVKNGEPRIVWAAAEHSNHPGTTLLTPANQAGTDLLNSLREGEQVAPPDENGGNGGETPIDVTPEPDGLIHTEQELKDSLIAIQEDLLIPDNTPVEVEGVITDKLQFPQIPIHLTLALHPSVMNRGEGSKFVSFIGARWVPGFAAPLSDIDPRYAKIDPKYQTAADIWYSRYLTLTQGKNTPANIAKVFGKDPSTVTFEEFLEKARTGKNDGSQNLLCSTKENKRLPDKEDTGEHIDFKTPVVAHYRADRSIIFGNAQGIRCTVEGDVIYEINPSMTTQQSNLYLGGRGEEAIGYVTFVFALKYNGASEDVMRNGVTASNNADMEDLNRLFEERITLAPNEDARLYSPFELIPR